MVHFASEYRHDVFSIIEVLQDLCDKGELNKSDLEEFKWSLCVEDGTDDYDFIDSENENDDDENEDYYLKKMNFINPFPVSNYLCFVSSLLLMLRAVTVK